MALRVAALTHFAVPFRNAGGETVLHQLLKALADAGHEVDLWMTDCPEAPPVTEYEGITIHGEKRHPVISVASALRPKPDVVITQFHRASLILKRAKRQAKTIYIAHNDMIVTHQMSLSMAPDLVVVNSDWVKESLIRRKMPLPDQVLTIHPPLGAQHRVRTIGDAVTMVNLNADKGSHVFYEMAARFPDQKFIGVVGSHGPQVIRKDLPNVEIVQNNPDLKPVWKRTKVVLMPSIYESYGLIPAEAGLSGIPTISTPTPGLKESRGKAGIFVDRDDLDGWELRLDTLLNDAAEYEKASDASKKRSTDLLAETKKNMKNWVSSVEGLVNPA